MRIYEGNNGVGYLVAAIMALGAGSNAARAACSGVFYAKALQHTRLFR
jgi:hypothetical protein